MRTENEQKQGKELYNSNIKELHRRYLSNVEHYDKALLTLSSSILGFSLLAMRYIVPLETADSIFLLIIAWGLMGLSVITSLLAYKISNKAINKEEKKAEDYYLHGIEDAIKIENPYKEWGRRLNWIPGILFVISLIFILSFVALNII